MKIWRRDVSAATWRYGGTEIWRRDVSAATTFLFSCETDIERASFLYLLNNVNVALAATSAEKVAEWLHDELRFESLMRVIKAIAEELHQLGRKSSGDLLRCDFP